MKKNLIITLTAVLISTFLISSCFISTGRPRYRTKRYRTVRVYIINNSPYVKRGVVKYYKYNRFHRRTFRLRPGRDIVIRADRYSKVRVRYNGRRRIKTVRRGGQRIYLR